VYILDNIQTSTASFETFAELAEAAEKYEVFPAISVR
jgi:hypothetical protein